MDIRQVDNSRANSRLRSRDYDMMPSLWRATAPARYGLTGFVGLGLY